MVIVSFFSIPILVSPISLLKTTNTLKLLKDFILLSIYLILIDLDKPLDPQNKNLKKKKKYENHFNHTRKINILISLGLRA